MPTTYARFDCEHTTEKTLSDLKSLGIHMRDAIHNNMYWGDETGRLWREIGRITVAVKTGLIELWPYNPIADTGMKLLRGAGIEAWRNPPTRETHWTQQKTARGRIWECIISADVADLADTNLGDHIDLIRAAEDRATMVTRKFLDDYDTAA